MATNGQWQEGSPWGVFANTFFPPLSLQSANSPNSSPRSRTSSPTSSSASAPTATPPRAPTAALSGGTSSSSASSSASPSSRSGGCGASSRSSASYREGGGGGGVKRRKEGKEARKDVKVCCVIYLSGLLAGSADGLRPCPGNQTKRLVIILYLFDMLVVSPGFCAINHVVWMVDGLSVPGHFAITGNTADYDRDGESIKKNFVYSMRTTFEARVLVW